MDKEISALEASKLRDDPEVLFVDVREADELSICSIAGAIHVPMGTIPERLGDLPKEKSLLVFCHHGMRSLRVAQYLKARGYDNVINLRGGIDAWAEFVEPEMSRY